LTMASAGTFLHTGLKLPYYMFFGKDSGIEAKEPPLNMLIAMGMAAFLCIGIGVLPGPLYNLLPYPVHFEPYTGDHVTSALGILLFTGLGFFMLLRKLDPEPTISVDTDWVYRKGSRVFMWIVNKPISAYESYLAEIYNTWFTRFTLLSSNFFARVFDVRGIDGIVNGVAEFFIGVAGNLRLSASGLVRNYAATMLIGGAIIIAYYLLTFFMRL
jgi:multicomponent Na+:H+ antiporter subunit D